MNLGKPDELTVLELAQLVLQLTKSKSEIVFRPLPEDDPKVRRPVIDLARETIGFSPKIALREGLARTIAYFEHARHEKRALRLISTRVSETANGNAR